jgi:ATP diphosphatase
VYEPTGEVSMDVIERALAIQREASVKGLDWKNALGVLEKIREELDELEQALRSGATESYNDEVGDILFSAVNLARMLAVDPEEALRNAIDKFERRFRGVLASIEGSGRNMEDMSVEELDVLWEKMKKAESSQSTSYLRVPVRATLPERTDCNR